MDVTGSGVGGGVAIRPFLGLIVLGGGYQRPAGNAYLLRLAGQIDSFGGRVGAGPGNDRNPPVRLLKDDPDHVKMLFIVQSGRLAGCAAGDDAVGAVLDLKIHQLAQFLFGNRAVFEWCHNFADTSFNPNIYLHI